MKSLVPATLSAIAIFFGCVLAHPVKYDQRQEGDLNVRTDVEDVLFVVVPPQDLVTVGMGLVAATAADLLRKNYGGIGAERWPLRTTSKVGFVPLEKSPYKVDLEKSGLKVKKVSHVGDPNRYNFHDGKNPVKAVPETKMPVVMEEKPAMVMVTEMAAEMASTTESKTVKKVLKPEDVKKVAMEESKKTSMEGVKMTMEGGKMPMEGGKMPMEDGKKTMEEPKKTVEDTKKTVEDSKKTVEDSKKTAEDSKKTAEDMKKTAEDMKKTAEDSKKTAEDTKKPMEGMKKTVMKTEGAKVKGGEKVSEESGLKIVGEGTKDGLDPSSILRIEGCGPESRRDSSGKCVFIKE